MNGSEWKNIFHFSEILIQVCLCVYAVYIIYIHHIVFFQASIQNVFHKSSELKTSLDRDKVSSGGQLLVHKLNPGKYILGKMHEVGVNEKIQVS